MSTPPPHNLGSSLRPKPLTLNTPLPPLREFTPTKDIRAHPLFTGILFPWVWRVYGQRLTRAGHYFLAATLIFTAFALFGLDQQWYVPLPYAFGLWTIAFLAMYRERPRVRLRAAHAGRIGAGETLPVEIEIEAVGRRGLGWVVLPDRLPLWVDAVPPEGVSLPTLRPGETARVRLGLHCRARGAYRLRGFRVETAFPLGLMVAQQGFPENSLLLVHPRWTPLARLDLPAGLRPPPGETAQAAQRGDSREFVGNRDYREGDPVRSIDWRATARLNRTVVREYREEVRLEAAVLLDTQVSAAPVPSGLAPPSAFEQAVSLAAAAGDWLARSGYALSFFASGSTLYPLTDGSAAAWDTLLDLLAAVEADDRTEAAPDAAWADALPPGTQVVCVLLDWDTARQERVERLQMRSVGVKTVIVRDGPCTLPPPTGRDITLLTPAQVSAGVEAL